LQKQTLSKKVIFAQSASQQTCSCWTKKCSKDRKTKISKPRLLNNGCATRRKSSNVCM